jgi:hypothetical protein
VTDGPGTTPYQKNAGWRQVEREWPPTSNFKQVAIYQEDNVKDRNNVQHHRKNKNTSIQGYLAHETFSLKLPI